MNTATRAHTHHEHTHTTSTHTSWTHTQHENITTSTPHTQHHDHNTMRTHAQWWATQRRWDETAHQSRRIKGFGQMPRLSLITNATTTAARQWGHEWFSQRHSDSSSYHHHHPYSIWWHRIATDHSKHVCQARPVSGLRQFAVLSALHSIGEPLRQQQQQNTDVEWSLKWCNRLVGGAMRCPACVTQNRSVSWFHHRHDCVS